MLNVRTTGKLEKDLARAKRRGKDLSKFEAVIGKLQRCVALDKKHRPHALSGDWKPCWECHIEPDWLLVYRMTESELTLLRTGTHSDLFG